MISKLSETLLEKFNFSSSSRKSIILTAGILVVFRGLKFETDTEIGEKVTFTKVSK